MGSKRGSVTLWQDVRLAVRILVKDKWFTAVAALALALGIGVNTTVFTFAHAVVLRGLPFADPDSIISITMTDAEGDSSACRASTSSIGRAARARCPASAC